MTGGVTEMSCTKLQTYKTHQKKLIHYVISLHVKFLKARLEIERYSTSLPAVATRSTLSERSIVTVVDLDLGLAIGLVFFLLSPLVLAVGVHLDVDLELDLAPEA